MKPSKEMRERADLHYAANRVTGYFTMRELLCAFAAAEVSLAVQECIEAQCYLCAKHLPLIVRSGRFGGTLYEHFDDTGVVGLCKSDGIHDYQKQLASEGEEV